MRDKNGKFIKGHITTKEVREKISNTSKGRKPWNTGKKVGKLLNSPFGKNHWNWRGDAVGYSGLHIRIKKSFPKPQNCNLCGKEAKLELANISQKYKLEISDWMWICRSCHMKQEFKLGIRKPSDISQKKRNSLGRFVN